MSKNPNLVPQMRPDRNGKIVKRWVSSNSGVSGAVGKIPTPAVQPKNGRQRAEEKLVSNLDRKISLDEVPEQITQVALDVLEQHPESDRVLGAVAKVIEDHSQKPETPIGHPHQLIRFAEVEATYDKYWEKSPLGNPYRFSKIADEVILAFAMREANERGDEGFVDASNQVLEGNALEEAVSAAHAFAAIHVYEHKGYTRVGTQAYDILDSHGDLAGAFHEFKDRTEEAVEFVFEHGPQAGALRQHMRGLPTSLGEGAL